MYERIGFYQSGGNMECVGHVSVWVAAVGSGWEFGPGRVVLCLCVL